MAKKKFPLGVLSPSDYAGTDQGVDYSGSGKIPALGSGVVTDVGQSSIIEGGSYPYIVYQLTDGPYKDDFVYVAENFKPKVKKGEKLRPGETVGEAVGKYPYIEVGFNQSSEGWNPSAPLYPNPHSPKAQGILMHNYIDGLSTGDYSTPATTVGSPTAPTGTNVSLLNPFSWGSGIQGFLYQSLFVIIGLALLLIGIGLIAINILHVNVPGIAGFIQGQQRISQAGSRIEESRRSSMAREGQADRRISGQEEARQLSARRLTVQEKNSERRNRNYVVRDKPNQVVNQ